MKSLRFALFCLIALAAFACETDPTFDEDQASPNTPDTPVSNTDTPTNLAVEYVTLLDLVNNLRAEGCQCGNEFKPPVAAVSWNEQLASAAERHSQDMDRNNHFAHQGTDGSNFGQRITAAGYRWRTAGENIAFRYFSAEAVFEGWKNSPGHCKNMMNAAFQEMGAARVDAYYSQEFAAQL